MDKAGSTRAKVIPAVLDSRMSRRYSLGKRPIEKRLP
ncbi:hypothetical protein ABIB90_000151 [Bradyrhizobium sp. JR4.1]|nr:hypothetical protein Bra1253DRAFT_04283 [Bradyrhizobium sp. WSM1253]